MEAKVNGPSRETRHCPDHVSRDDASFLKVGQNVESEAGQDAAPGRHNNDPLANEIVAPFELPLGNLPMSDVDATGD